LIVETLVRGEFKMNSRMDRETELDRRAVLLALFSLGAHASIAGFAGEGESTAVDLPTTLEEKVAHFLANRERPSPHRASLEFYSGLSRSELQQLLSHERGDVAMRSAWEFVRRDSKPPQLVQFDLGPLSQEFVVRDGKSPESVDQFLKVTRRTLGIQPPKWWEKAIRTAKFRLRHPLALGMNTKLYPTYSLDPEGWYLQRGQKLQRRESELRLVVGKRSLPIPAAVFEQRKNHEHSNCLVAKITDNGAFLVCHRGHDSGVPLYRINDGSGDIAWQARIWVDNRDTGGGEGLLLPPTKKDGAYAITLIHDSGRILVFGADQIQAHVEGFRATDGENQFRFCTSF
jgi:hypothetical protein